MRSTLQSVAHFFSLRKKKRKDWAFPEELCRRFSLAEIRAAIDQCYREKLDFDSVVYKGHIKVDREEDRTDVVAIKYISRRVHEFRAEVQILCQLRHPNIISLIGFCQENGKCTIVYKHMPNGTLYNYLFDTSHVRNKDAFPLTWEQRLKICIGVARAIHYLHAGVKHAVIHRDVTCRSIMLDQNMVPKLSGLGFAKMGPPALSNALIRLNTNRIVGTLGYMEREYAMNGQFTEKSDVFSFGMVLFEVLCAKSCSVGIPRCVDRGETFPAMIDPFLVGKVAPDCLKIFLNIAERCVRPTGAERPTMGEVEVELECALELQESADAVKQLKESGTTASSSLAPPPAHDMEDYTYQDVSFSEITETFSKDPFPFLDLDAKAEKLIEVARSIHCLHAGVKHTAIHRDVKCFDILLDHNLVPKLSDLGIAKLDPPALSNALIKLNSGVSGTIGYPLGCCFDC